MATQRDGLHKVSI